MLVLTIVDDSHMLFCIQNSNEITLFYIVNYQRHIENDDDDAAWFNNSMLQCFQNIYLKKMDY